MNGSTVELVASSWIEALGGLSRWYIFSTPPLFCASATPELKTRAATRPPVRIIGRKDYTIGLNTTGNGVDDPDQAFFENFSCRSERNYNGYCNGEIERLFELQSSEPDPEKRKQMVWEIDAKLLADGARPTIMWNRNATCWQPYVKGYVAQVNSMFNAFRFEDVWLDR